MKSSHSSTSSKSSKKSKDKEKRKSRSVDVSGDLVNNNAEKTKEGHKLSRTNTRFTSDTIACIADQTLPEQLSESVRESLTDEITYKVRELIHGARVRMRQNKRNTLKISDIDSTLQYSNVERIYGPSHCDWVPVGDPDKCSRVLDTTVNLIDTATSGMTFHQPGPPVLKSEWLCADSTAAHVYYEKACKAILHGNRFVSHTALHNLRTNKSIATISPMFLNLCYLTLMNDCKDEDKILMILRCIAHNPHCALVHPEKECQLILLVLISQLYTVPNLSVHKDEICTTVNAMLQCWPEDRCIVLEAIDLYSKKLSADENCPFYPRQILQILCNLGLPIINEMLWSNANLLTETPFHMIDIQFKHALLYCSSFVYRYGNFSNEWDRILYNILGDSLLPHRIAEYRKETKQIEYKITPQRNLKLSFTNFTPTNRLFNSSYPFFTTCLLKRNDIKIRITGCTQLRTKHSKFKQTYDPWKVNNFNLIVISKRHIRKEKKVQSCKSHSLFMCL